MSLPAHTIATDPSPDPAPHLALGEGCLGRLIFPAGWRYLLLLRRDAGGRRLKPMAFARLDQLARHIHRARGDGQLTLTDALLLMAGEADSRRGVSLWIAAGEAGPRRYLGWAWIDGAGVETLRAALARTTP